MNYNVSSIFTNQFNKTLFYFTSNFFYLGAHVEGPFISEQKKGAHDKNHIKNNITGIQTFQDTYGSLENITIITVAPELPGVMDAIPQLVEKNINVSIGLSTSRHKNITFSEP